MQIIKEKFDNNFILKIIGYIDMSNSGKIKKEILDTNEIEILLDFEKVEYIDSSGIGMLISLYKQFQLKGGSLRIIKVNSKLKGLLEMVGLNKLLPID